MAPSGGETVTARPGREYPARPIVGVGAVVLVPLEREGADGGDGVVLVRRRFPPLQGEWSLPGGTVEVGETLAAAVAREAREETGLVVDVGPVVEVLDRILHDADGRVQYHFVLVDYLCRPAGGSLRAASDAADVAVAPCEGLEPYRLSAQVVTVIRRAVGMARDIGRSGVKRKID